MKIIAKPHASTMKGAHDMIDLYRPDREDGGPGIVWATVHLDFFWGEGDERETIYNALYKRGETVALDLTLA